MCCHGCRRWIDNPAEQVVCLRGIFTIDMKIFQTNGSGINQVGSPCFRLKVYGEKYVLQGEQAIRFADSPTE